MYSGAYHVPSPPTHFAQNLDEARSGRHLGVGRYRSDTAVGKDHTDEPHAGADGDTGSVLGPSTGPEPSKAPEFARDFARSNAATSSCW